MAIAFLLFTLILSIFMIHGMLQVCCSCFYFYSYNSYFSHYYYYCPPQVKFHYLPESLAVVFLGAVLGLLMTVGAEGKLTKQTNKPRNKQTSNQTYPGFA